MPPIAHNLMVQGTGSDAGKSTLVAGLCRVLVRRGVCVAPFKPQNMALNSAVTKDGGEIGRAQALQAQACGIAPSVHMNPILLKPSSDCHAQVIVQGKVMNTQDAWGFHGYKKAAMPYVLDSFSRLNKDYDYVLVEGAGSPAEINLRDNDIANMGFAEAVDCPVILIADIDKGGVFAQIVGTLELLSASERERIVGFVINRFRGDVTLLQPGLDWLEEYTGKPVLGVLPYLHNLFLDAEDGIDTQQGTSKTSEQFRVVVPVLPRISNHTDFDALRLHPGVDLHFASIEQPLPPCDLLILPGSKNARSDFASLVDKQRHHDILRHVRYGGKVLGICGGLQMLGNTIHDPHGVEGEPGSSDGLGLLDLDTELGPHKQLLNRSATLHQSFCDALSIANVVTMHGYEIHCGTSVGSALNKPVFMLDTGEAEGASSSDNSIAGTYLHGLFDSPDTCDAILHWAGKPSENTHAVDVNAERERQLNRLADMLETHLKPEFLAQMASPMETANVI